MLTFMGLGGLELIFIFFFALGIFILPIVALVDIVRSEFTGPNDKLIWVLIVVFLSLPGAVVYYFVGRNQRVS